MPTTLAGIFRKYSSRNKGSEFPYLGTQVQATYPFQHRFPFQMKQNQLAHYKGNFGKPLKGKSLEQQFVDLPSYARVKMISRTGKFNT